MRFLEWWDHKAWGTPKVLTFPLKWYHFKWSNEMDRKHVMMTLQHGKNDGMCMSLVCPKSSAFVRDFASLLIEKPSSSNIYLIYPQSSSAPWSWKLLDDNDNKAISWKMAGCFSPILSTCLHRCFWSGIISGKWPEHMIFTNWSLKTCVTLVKTIPKAATGHSPTRPCCQCNCFRLDLWQHHKYLCRSLPAFLAFLKLHIASGASCWLSGGVGSYSFKISPVTPKEHARKKAAKLSWSRP